MKRITVTPKLKIPLLIIFSILTINNNGYAQEGNLKTVTVLKSQKRYLSGIGGLNGVSKLVIPINLPENTVSWYYAFSALDDKSESQKTDLIFNLGSIILKAYTGNWVGVIPGILKTISPPPGTQTCDVYHFPNYAEAEKFERTAIFKEYSYVVPSTQKGLSSGYGEITQSPYLKGTQYLGLANPTLAKGVLVSIEVVALVWEEVKINGWSRAQRENFFNYLKSSFLLSEAGNLMDNEQLNIFCQCFVSKMIDQYQPESFRSMTNYEIKQKLEGLGKSCIDEIKLQSAFQYQNQERVFPNDLYGKWKDENSLISIYRNGSIEIEWDSGTKREGLWRIEDGQLIFDLKNSKQPDRYYVIELSPKTLVYVLTDEERSSQVWHANKVQ